MTNNNYLRIILLALFVVCQTVVWAADTIRVDNGKADSEKVILKGDAAYKWIGEHLDSLADSYLAKNGNILDPDIVREELKTIGYNGLNVTDYIMGSRQIDSLVLIKLLDRAEQLENKTIYFMMGCTAAGKSTALRHNPEIKAMVEKAGLVYDGAFISVPSFETRLKMVQDRGFKASIVFVHNDPETGFTNMINRMIKSNRAMSLYYYILSYPRFHGRIAYLQENHPDVELYCLDNNHNNGGVQVSIEEALKWDYTMSEHMEKRLHDIMNEYINSGRLTPEQIQALKN